MAKLLPPYIDKNCTSNGEKIIFELLKNSPFTDDWIVLHSLNLSQHTKRLYGEIDFLLLIPGSGIFVMEVKGGDVKCVNGVWHFTNKSGYIVRGKNPFEQSQEAMFSLARGIRKHFGPDHKFNKFQFGFFVSFPQIEFNRNSVEYDPWQIFDKHFVSNGSETFFKNLITEYTNKHKDETWFSLEDSLPSKDDLLQLCDFLRGDFERIRTIEDRLIEFDKHVKKYTEEQFRILDSIQHNNRSLIQGGAGTGKTMIAIESAIRAANEGQRVFLTCYNRIIGEWMHKHAKEWEGKIVVSNLHNYLFELSSGFDYDKSQSNKQDFYSKYLPVLLKEYFKLGIGEQFDKLIIDEGQDLIREEYLSLFDSMLKGGLKDGNWEIYGDFEKQAIYTQLSKGEMFDLLKRSCQYSNFILKINCRNTKEIGEETTLISGFEKPPFLLEYLEGIPVEYYFYKDDEHQREILAEKLRKLISSSIPYNELTILSPRKLDNSCLKTFKDYPIKEIKKVDDVSVPRMDFGFATVQSYKGMECNYVLVSDIDDLASDTSRALMYVAMSRARYGLVLLIHESIKHQYDEILKNKLN